MASTEEGTISLKSKPYAGRANKRGSDRKAKSTPNNSGSKQSQPSKEVRKELEKGSNSDVDDDRDKEDAEEKEICLVCADVIKYEAIYPCNHTVCHVCALRLRALMKDNHCALCRTVQDKVIITVKSGANFDDFSEEQLAYQEPKYGVYFEDRQTKDDVLSLLKLRCPRKGCNEVFHNWKELKNHVKQIHNREFCEICTRHKKAFSIEFPLYTSWGLQKHQKEGDEKTGFTGHPRCGFCRLYFYSDEELFVHCREKHERCFICDRNRVNNRPEHNYYRDYQSLEKHFREQHYACGVQSCLDKKFVVFDSKLELQDHMINTHPEIVGTSRQARIVETNFTFSRPGVAVTSSSSSSSSPSSSVAFSSSSVSSPAVLTSLSSAPSARFGSQLSTYSGPLSTTMESATTSTITTTNTISGSTTDSFPVLGSQRSATPTANRAQVTSVERFHANTPPGDNSPVTMKRRLEERARMYLNYDVSKFEKFQDINGQFSSGTINGKSVIFEYTQLFKDIKVTEMEILVHELQGIYKTKSAQLEKALQNWIEKQSPLSHQPVGTGGASNMLSSTWAANRSNSLRQGGLTAQDFPSLPISSSASSSQSVSPVSKVVRTASNLNKATRSLESLNLNDVSNNNDRNEHKTSQLDRAKVFSASTPNYSRNSSSSSLSDSLFPALPQSKVKSFPLKRPDTTPTTSAWDSSAQSVPSSSRGSLEDLDSVVGTQTRKQKGKKKQVLYKLGAFSVN